MFGPQPQVDRSVGPLRTFAHHQNNTRGLFRVTPYNKDAKGRPKRQQVVRSAGTDMAYPQQAVQVNIFRFNKDEYGLRKSRLDPLRTDDRQLLAPLGTDPNVFQVKQYELVFTIVNDPNYVGTQRFQMPDPTANPVSTCSVFACVNGLHEDTPLKSIGITATDNDATPHSITMNIGTVITKGAATAYHSGPYRILCRSGVYWDARPYAAWDTKGQLINLLHRVGAPGNPDSDDPGTQKFIPALYGMTCGDSAALNENTVREVTSVFKELVRTENLTSWTQFEALEKKVEDMATTMMQERPHSFPLPPLIWHAFYNLVVIYNDQSDIIANVGKKIDERIVSFMRRDRNSFNTAIGQSSLTQGPLFAVFAKDFVPSTPDDNAKRLCEHKKNMLEALTSMHSQLIINLRGWLSHHRIGFAMNDAVPGNNFQIELDAGVGEM